MLTLKKIRKYCGSLKGVTEDFPFDFQTLVFKVGGKMFALTDIDSPELSLNLKCDPYLSLELRSRYSQVTPGYHMNKKHWNTVVIDGAIPDREVLDLIDHSYNLVLRGLKKSVRDEIEGKE
jgi:predicted DNA-binding protein (MmcQ/YjbR family)